MSTYGRVLAALYDEPQLLLDKVSERGPFTTRNLVLVCEDLRISRLRTRLGQEKRFQIVVDCVPDEDAILQERRSLFLHVFERSCCDLQPLNGIQGEERRLGGDVPWTMSEGLIPENSVR